MQGLIQGRSSPWASVVYLTEDLPPTVPVFLINRAQERLLSPAMTPRMQRQEGAELPLNISLVLLQVRPREVEKFVPSPKFSKGFLEEVVGGV